MRFRHYMPVFRIERLIYKQKLTQYQVRVSKQSVRNYKKVCHRYWLCLRHAVSLHWNIRKSDSIKLNWMAWN